MTTPLETQCEPANREWPRKCDRCTSLGLSCSPSEDIRGKSTNTSHILSPRTGDARITKQRNPHRTTSLASASSSLAQNADDLIARTPTRLVSPPLPSLCESCEQLQLSRSRFLIPTRGLKGTLGRASTRLESPGTGREIKIPTQRVNLGSLSEIRDRAQLGRCNFCYLVWQSAEDQLVLTGRRPASLDMSVCAYAIWQIDGRELIFNKDASFFRPVTRHIRLAWETSDWLKDTYIVLRGDDQKLPGFDKAFLGREVQPTQTLARIAATTKAWVEDCNNRHEKCSSAPSARLRPREDAHLRVVDIHNAKLVPLTASTNYVVLSYIWNQPDELFLETYSLKSWESGRLSELQAQLSQTIQDTMSLIRDLGIRYLWTDSLCIVQNDQADKQANYSDMDRVLANASLTICAVDGLQTTAVNQHIRDCGGKLSLMVHHPVETHIQNSQWSKGAWTCQDRLLSGRCLIFIGSRVWFQCQEESMSEDTFEPSFQGRCADWVQSPAQIWSELAHQHTHFRAYIKCVESYSSRKHQQENQVLQAFEGISHFLGIHMQTRFFGGLPSSYFDAAILWMPAIGESCTRKYCEKPVAPSWSWAGWTGQATYRPPILTGPTENIRDWLKSHTWISWFLVDRNSKVVGEIGTYAKADLPDWADGREKRANETGPRFVRNLRPKTEERWPSRKRCEFTKWLPAPHADPVDGTDGMSEGLSYFLQFWTWSAFLRLGSSSGVFGSRIRRYTILDRSDEICGSVSLPDEFVNRVDNGASRESFEFIATSDARIFFDEEMPEWTYYIPKEKHDSSWDLWYVILLETDEDGISRRLGVGKVFKDAFHQSFFPGMDWREFILA